MFGFSHGTAPTLRCAFQTESVEHRFLERQSRGQRGTQSTLSHGAHTDMTPLVAYENLRIFAQRWGKKYPSLARLGNERNAAYFTYLRFSESVRRMIYSTNWVERLNRSYKRTLLMRGAMPSPASVVYLLGSVAKEKTEGTYARRLPYFGEWKIW